MAKKRKKAKVLQMKPKMSLSKYIKLRGRSLPIHEVLMSESIMSNGKGHVVVTRAKKSGAKIVGIFLVDIWCLGVKDTFYRQYERYDYEDFINSMSGYEGAEVVEVEPNHAFNMIYGALEYAEDLGLDPHKDFSITEYLLDPVESIEYEEIEFGYNGRPAYYYYDGDKKADILNKLSAAVGKDGFDFVDGEVELDNFEYEGDFDYEKLANSRFKSESDKDSFLSYVSMLKGIDNAFFYSIEVLKTLYNTDHEKLVDSVIQSVLKNNGIVNLDRKEFELLKSQSNVIISAVEKYLIHEEVDFMTEAFFLDGFDTITEELRFSVGMSNINLFHHGKEKLELLCNYYFEYLRLNEIEVVKNKSKHLFDLLSEFAINPLHFDYPTTILLTVLDDHMSEFGDIDFGELDLDP